MPGDRGWTFTARDGPSSQVGKGNCSAHAGLDVAPAILLLEQMPRPLSGAVRRRDVPDTVLPEAFE